MIRVIVPFALLAVSACNYDSTPEGPPSPPPPPPPGKCIADGLGGFTGKTRSDGLEKKALRMSGSLSARWISPGMAVTMDFREDRLNFELDAQGKIVRAFCG